MILRDIHDPFSCEVIDAFSEGVKAFGYRVMLSNVGSDPTEEEYFLQLFSDRISDGVLVLGDSPRSERLTTAIADTVKHIVGFAQDNPLPGVVSVALDNAQGTNLALDYLYGLGHQRIAHIACTRYTDLRLRLEAYKQYMAARVLGLPEDYIQVVPSNSISSGRQAMLTLLDMAQPPTAVYVTTDRLALGALRAAAERGVRVPTELSIMGFDDLAFSEAVWPPLPTVHYPIKEMAQKAAEVLIEMIGGRRPADAPMSYIMKPTLVVRASCAAPRAL
jgi:LacI family repressor for deo operon, udp, cdd, tsx, nupC, and nupG